MKAPGSVDAGTEFDLIQCPSEHIKSNFALLTEHNNLVKRNPFFSAIKIAYPSQQKHIKRTLHELSHIRSVFCSS